MFSSLSVSRQGDEEEKGAEQNPRFQKNDVASKRSSSQDGWCFDGLVFNISPHRSQWYIQIVMWSGYQIRGEVGDLRRLSTKPVIIILGIR